MTDEQQTLGCPRVVDVDRTRHILAPGSVQKPCAACGEMVWTSGPPRAADGRVIGIDEGRLQLVDEPPELVISCLQCCLKQARRLKDMESFHMLHRMLAAFDA